jgi:hypothetical protein
VYEAPTIIGTCINCATPGSLGGTLALIVIGGSIALAVERRKLARVNFFAFGWNTDANSWLSIVVCIRARALVTYVSLQAARPTAAART